jgi:hypothetical protein
VQLKLDSQLRVLLAQAERLQEKQEGLDRRIMSDCWSRSR